MAKYKRFKAKPLLYADVIGATYAKKIELLVKEFTAIVLEETKKVVAIDSIDDDKKAKKNFMVSFTSRLQEIKNRFNANKKKQIKQIATRLSSDIDDHSKMQIAKQVKSLEMPKIKTDKILKRLNIGDAVERKTTEIAELITSLSTRVVDRIENELKKTETLGDAKKIYNIVLESGEVMQNRAIFIAEQTTRATLSAFNTERSKATGATQFEWIHSSAGLNPRPLHVSYDGRIFDFDDPPIINEETGRRGMPAEEPNCRCFYRVVYELEE